MGRIDFKVTAKGGSGRCSKCNTQTDNLFTVEISDESRANQMTLCYDCAKKIYNMVKKKNESAEQAAAQISSSPSVPSSPAAPAAAVPSYEPAHSPVYAESYAAQAEDEMYCPQCGKPIPANSAFCSYCGANFGMRTQNVKAKKKNPFERPVNAINRLPDRITARMVIAPLIISVGISVLEWILSIVFNIIGKQIILPEFISGYFGDGREPIVVSSVVISLLGFILSLAVSCFKIFTLYDGSSIKMIAYAQAASGIVYIFNSFRTYYTFVSYHQISNNITTFLQIVSSNIPGFIILALIVVFILLFSSEKVKNSAFGRFLDKCWFIFVLIYVCFLVLMNIGGLSMLFRHWEYESQRLYFINKLVNLILSILTALLLPAYVVKLSREESEDYSISDNYMYL